MFFAPLNSIRRWQFRHDVRRISEPNFSIISSNCLGGRIYETLGRPYLTPTVGLYFYPKCFTKFVGNLRHYLSITPRLVRHSRYVNDITYPVAELDDIEVHFLHYANGDEAIDKWLRRCERVNYANVFLTMTDRDGFSQSSAEAYDLAPFQNKVLFAAQQWPIASTVLIPRYKNQNCVGDLYSNYHEFVGTFSFATWIENAQRMTNA